MKVGVDECNLGKLSKQIRSEHFSDLALVEVISLRFLRTCKISKKLMYFFSFFFGTFLSDFFHTEGLRYWLIFIFAFQRLICACESRC